MRRTMIAKEMLAIKVYIVDFAEVGGVGIGSGSHGPQAR